MSNGTATIIATGKFVRRDGTTDVEADDMEKLHAKVPAGRALVSVRRL